MNAKDRLYHERYNEEDMQKDNEKNQYKSLTESKRGTARDYLHAQEKW